MTKRELLVCTQVTELFCCVPVIKLFENYMPDTIWTPWDVGYLRIDDTGRLGSSFKDSRVKITAILGQELHAYFSTF